MAKRMESYTNPITGDRMITRAPSKEYAEGWDRIFGKKKEPEEPEKQTMKISRIDLVGLNGATGEHYDES